MGFSLKQRIQEKNPLWAIAFSPDTFVHEQNPIKVENTEANPSDTQGQTHYHCFATCGGQTVTLYEYQARKGLSPEVDSIFHQRQSHTSSHKEEDFYAVTFAQRQSALPVDRKGKKEEEQWLSRSVLCVGGACGKILILDVETGSLHATLEGSTSYILDLKSITCGSGKQKYNLLCSATRDQVRVWNLDTLANVCIFAGDPDGHVGDVLTVAWHHTGARIVSGGGDAPEDDGSDRQIISRKRFQICVWNVLDSPRLQEAIQASSYLPDSVSDRSQFNPHIERFAVSVHNDVHSNRVDCVAWLDDLILSKSIFDEIILWQPIIHDESTSNISDSASSLSSIIPIKTFCYAGNDSFYFVRFALSMDCTSSLLAIGNNNGQVYLWDIDDIDNEDDRPLQIIKTSHTGKKKKAKMNKKSSIMRGLAFSPDGEILVACDENGSVYHWNKNQMSIL